MKATKWTGFIIICVGFWMTVFWEKGTVPQWIPAVTVLFGIVIFILGVVLWSWQQPAQLPPEPPKERFKDVWPPPERIKDTPELKP